MIMTWMLSVKVPISFVIVPKAFVMTAAGFLILFQTLLILSLARIRKLEIIELIKAAQKPKKLAGLFEMAHCAVFAVSGWRLLSVCHSECD